GLALGSRLFALRGNPGIELPLLRRLTLGELAAVVAVLAAAGLLVNLAPPRTTAAGTASGVAPASASGPALRLAGFAGRVAVALAVTRQDLEFLVLPPGGRSPTGFELTAEAERPGGMGTTLYPRSCGEGCFAIRYRLRPGTTTIAATVASPSSPAATVRFAVPGPLTAARPELLRRMKVALRNERSVTVVERLSAGSSTQSTTSTFHLTGPGLLAADPLVSPVDVRVLGREHGLTQLSFATEDGTAWYRAWIDGRDRLRRERIVRPGLLGERTVSYGATVSDVTGPGPVATRSIPIGPFVLGREAGDLALGLAARPAGSGRLAVTTTVLGQDGNAATGLDLRVRLRSRSVSTAHAAPCGAGCYAATLAVTGRPRAADVTIRRLGRVPSTVRFPFPSRWPPPSATRIAARATRVFARLRSLTIDERLGSNATNVQHTIWRLQAPNRLSYSIEGGEQAIVVGDRRWDRSPGANWLESPQQPVKQPAPTWGAAPAEAALLGPGSVRGRPVWRISFVDRSVPAWYTISVDRQTGRTLGLEMTAAAHFMHHVYSGFDAAPGIAPPR
ncbi:MAG TPA: hypothetical protein VFM41_09630, partial [Gaiella sp.]|nr:hypothetical protein [Gaiella sp.]